jgi:RloB-like protein
MRSTSCWMTAFATRTASRSMTTGCAVSGCMHTRGAANRSGLIGRRPDQFSRRGVAREEVGTGPPDAAGHPVSRRRRAVQPPPRKDDNLFRRYLLGIYGGVAAAPVLRVLATTVPEIDQVWSLFDHDGRKKIDQVCLRAKLERMHVSLSHQFFEPWLLVHLREFTPGYCQNGRSETIIDKLHDAHPAFANYAKWKKRIDKSHAGPLDRGVSAH